MVKGIDVSHWQGPTVIPEMIKHNGIKYVMIRAGHGITHDDKCESFVKQCEEYGLEYGFYWYYEGNSQDAWEKQTEMLMGVAKIYNPTLPLAIDYEQSISFGNANQLALHCGTAMENAGYFVVIYSNKSFFKTLWGDEVKKRFAFWLASYNNERLETYREKANIVIVQTGDRYEWISVDTDEFDDKLLGLCSKVSNEWVDMNSLLATIYDKLHNSSGSVCNFKIHKNGDRYRM